MDSRKIFDQTFSLEIVIASVVFAAVCGTLLVALYRGRARPGRKPSRQSKHPKTEMVYVSVVTCVAAFLISFSIWQNNSEDIGKKGDPAMKVMVTGFQWCWRFAYTGTRVVITGNCLANKGPTLTLPEGTPVRVDVTSADVVHEMWIPYLRFKLEAIPGHINSFTTRLTTEGTFNARCSEFCGLYHYAMVFRLHVVSQRAYRTWLAGEEAKAAEAKAGAGTTATAVGPAS